jgi:hypothetical protein
VLKESVVTDFQTLSARFLHVDSSQARF